MTKPIADRLVALFLLALASPIFLLLHILLKAAQGGSPYFAQERIGYLERPFVAFKFRTMNEARDQDGQLLPDDQRLTKVGTFVRKTSLDELPQLINVLRGDMSFVGPRPLLPEYLPYYSPEQKRRHLVRPGITGLAQVNGRNQTTWEARFDWDVRYVDHVSLLLDLKILLLTVLKVLKSEGISADGHATMPKFSEYMKSKNV